VKKLEAEIALCYEDSITAKAVAQAVSPDNLRKFTGLSVKTISINEKVVSRIRCHAISTLIATIDDLLFCVSTAEKSVKIAKRLAAIAP